MPPWLAVLALLAFGLRGLIPVGFEPAQGSVALVLCHDGFPAHFFSRGRSAHGRQAGGASRDAHCVFCNSSVPAPAFTVWGVARVAPVSIGIVHFFRSHCATLRLAHTPQARAPPRLA